MEWISVKEQMPEYEGVFLVHVNGKVRIVSRETTISGVVWNGGGLIANEGFNPIDEKEITHWLRLPDIPI